MRKIYLKSFVVLFVIAFSVGLVSGQAARSSPVKTVQENPSTDVLIIENEDGRQTKLTAAEIGKLKRQSVKVKDHDKETVFEGFALVEVLKLAGIEFGDALRGKRLAGFLLVEAADKYQAVFALPELDPAFTDKVILLVDKRDGQPLAKAEGVFRLVVPDEKKQGRWVRQVVSMKILRTNGLSR